LFRLESGNHARETLQEISLRAGATPGITLATEPCAKVGSLQPNTVPLRAQIDHPVVRKLFSFGHLLDRHGEREGD